MKVRGGRGSSDSKTRLMRVASLVLAGAGTACVFRGSWLLVKMKSGSHRYSTYGAPSALQGGPPTQGFVNFLNDQRRAMTWVLGGVGLQFGGVMLAAARLASLTGQR
jgi:hypothetical protein